MNYNPLLVITHFDVQIASDLASGSPCRLVSVFYVVKME